MNTGSFLLKNTRGFVNDFSDEEVSFIRRYLANQSVCLRGPSPVECLFFGISATHGYILNVCQDSEYVYFDQYSR